MRRRLVPSVPRRARRAALLPVASLAAALHVPRAGRTQEGGGQAPRATADTILPGAALQADLDLLARAEEALHPGLYRYQTPAAWRARVAALRREVATGMGPRAFYGRLAELTAAVRCGHSYPNFFNQSAAVRARVLDAGRRLPFLFRWAGDTLVVVRDLTPPAQEIAALRPGTRVLAIDGVPAARVLARLLPMARADGANDAKRREVLSVTGGEAYEAFDVYYPLRFALAETVTLDVRPPDGPGGPAAGPARVRVATMTAGEREAARAAGAAPPAAPATVALDPNPLGWTLALRADSTAVLTMPSWATYEHAGWDWRGWLGRALARVAAAGAPRLVLDRRDNEGGADEVAHALLAALARRPVTLVGLVPHVRYRTLPADLRPSADTWDRAFDDWTTALAGGADAAPVRGPGGQALYRLRPGRMGADTTVIVPGPRPLGAERVPDAGARGTAGRATERATGPVAVRVAVLVGPVNSSSTYAFAEAVRRSGLATLVGAPTGGNRRGINGGGFYFFRLPRSGIEIDIPLVGYYPPETGPGATLARVPDAGLAPDVPVAASAAALSRALQGGPDATLASAVAALRRAAGSR